MVASGVVTDVGAAARACRPIAKRGRDRQRQVKLLLNGECGERGAQPRRKLLVDAGRGRHERAGGVFASAARVDASATCDGRVEGIRVAFILPSNHLEAETALDLVAEDVLSTLLANAREHGDVWVGKRTRTLQQRRVRGCMPIVETQKAACAVVCNEARHVRCKGGIARERSSLHRRAESADIRCMHDALNRADGNSSVAKWQR